jgi:metal-responsive CopG/Arc/MetJ family transcriptional regulator
MPRTTTDPKIKHVLVKISVLRLEELDGAARRHRLDRSAFIRAAVAEKIAKEAGR